MKKTFFFSLLAISSIAALCVYADSITLNNKKTYSGEILEMNEDGIKIKDKSKGMTIFVKWDNMSLASIKEHNPDLYEEKVKALLSLHL